MAPPQLLTVRRRYDQTIAPQNVASCAWYNFEGVKHMEVTARGSRQAQGICRVKRNGGILPRLEWA